MRTTRRSLIALTVSLAAVAGACSDDVDPVAAGGSTRTDGEGSSDVDISEEDPGDPGGGGGGGRFLRLAPFSDCSAFLDHVKAEASDRVGPYGLDPSGYPFAYAVMESSAAAAEEFDAAMPAGTMAPTAMPVSETAATTSLGGFDAGDADQAASAEASGTATVAGTNTQEVGVDEPDIVKADGDRIVTISENVLTYVDISGDEPVVTGRLTIPEGWGHQLFLAGDRAVLVTNTGGTYGQPMPVDVAVGTVAPDSTIAPSIVEQPYSDRPSATLIEVDLSNPADLRIAATLRIEGQYLNARAVGDRLLLAVSTGPQWMPWLYPQTSAGEERARQANQQLVAESTLADWLPEYQLEISGGATSTGELLGCDRIDHPAEFSGFDVISVVPIDLTAGIASGVDTAAATGVLAGGQTVYASLDRFYVATNRWAPADVIAEGDVVGWTDDYTTDLHAFSITAGEPVEYVASGSVPGTLLNSFSLDEHEGYLRVLTTDGTPWDQSNLSETSLTVLAEQDDRLLAVGEVGGIGRGESLYSARLIGDRGFAVTFRQTDPFYVLDLSDPTAPAIAGELKIPGYSTYLHPVGEHRVLGIGRDATEDGMMLGLKLSLFDVADPADPIEISTWTLPDGQSTAEYDYHAFQMIGSTAILPVQSYNDGFNGAIVFDIGDSIVERGRISHQGDAGMPASDCRQLVPGDLPDTSPAYWLTVDTVTHYQLCGAGQAGGYGDWYCDVVTLDMIPSWFGSEQVSADLVSVAGGDLDRLSTLR